MTPSTVSRRSPQEKSKAELPVNKDRGALRFGIAPTVGAGLSSMVFLLVVLSTVALYGFNDFRTVLSQLSNTTLPQVTYGARISSQLSHLLYLTERLSKVETEPGRRIAYKAIKRQFKLISDAARNVDYGAREEDVASYLTALAAALEELNTLVQSRVEVKKQTNAATAAIVDFGDEITQLMESARFSINGAARMTSHDSGDEVSYISQWFYQALTIINIGLKAPYLDSVHKIRKTKNILKKEFKQLKTDSDMLPGHLQVNFAARHAALKAGLLGDNGVIPLQEQLMKITAKSMSRGNFARSMVEEVGSLGTGLFMEMNATAAENSAELTEDIQDRMLLFGILSLAAFITAIGVFLFLIHHLAQRLVRLNNQVLARVAGEEADIQIAGNDEISDIAHSINYFASEIRIAKDQAERSNVAKSQFLAHMSHEIRTPMNAIIGLTDLALRRNLEPKLRDYLQKVDFSAQSLLDILNDILDVSKIESGKLTLEDAPFSLETTLENLSGLIGLRAEDKNLEVIFNLSPTIPKVILGDSLRLGQILLNLTNNAIKFTEAGEITISVKSINPMRAALTNVIKLQFSVKDTGIGLTPEQQRQLFQPFYQADASTTRKYGGSGLGLSICKSLIEMMGGVISVNSESGKGSDFYFTAQFKLPEKVEYHDFDLTEEFQGRNVLVVDDNRAARENLMQQLKTLSLLPTGRASGPDALKTLAEHAEDHFALILVDWAMPQMDGLALLFRLMENERTSRIPTLLMASTYSQELISRQGAIDSSSLLVKPVTLSSLHHQVLHLFGNSKGRSQFFTQHSGADANRFDAIAGARVLVVEDNILNQQVVQEHLQQVGVHASVTSNGIEAIQAVARDTFDIILMDIQMPDMDGLEATRAIRAFEQDQKRTKTPIIAMTAHAQTKEQQHCLDAGMDDYLTKPFVPEHFYTLLLKWIPAQAPPHALDATPFPPLRKTPSPSPAALPDLTPALDLHKALEFFGGDVAFLQEHINKFIAEYKGADDKMRKHLADGDFTTLERSAHTLKSIADGYGAETLRKACLELEDAARERTPDMAERLAPVSALFQDVYQALEAVSLTPPPQSQQCLAIDEHSPFADTYQKLAELTRNGELESLEYFRAHRHILCGAFSDEVLQKIERHLESYDFEEALAALMTSQPTEANP